MLWLLLDVKRRRLAGRGLGDYRGGLLWIILLLLRWLLRIRLLLHARLRTLLHTLWRPLLHAGLRTHRCLLRIRLCCRRRSTLPTRSHRIALRLSALTLNSHEFVVPLLRLSKLIVGFGHCLSVVLLLQGPLLVFLFLNLALRGLQHLFGLLEFLERALVLSSQFQRFLPFGRAFIGTLLGPLDRGVRTHYRGLLNGLLGLSGRVTLLIRLRVRLWLSVCLLLLLRVCLLPAVGS